MAPVNAAVVTVTPHPASTFVDRLSATSSTEPDLMVMTAGPAAVATSNEIGMTGRTSCRWSVAHF